MDNKTLETAYMRGVKRAFEKAGQLGAASDWLSQTSPMKSLAEKTMNVTPASAAKAVGQGVSTVGKNIARGAGAVAGAVGKGIGNAASVPATAASNALRPVLTGAQRLRQLLQGSKGPAQGQPPIVQAM
jgi:hypothetical protein